MKHLFAVIRERGPAWDDSRPLLEQQDGWHAHAEFMDALAAEGFVLVAGPLEGTRSVLLIILAEVREWRLRLGRGLLAG